MNEISDFCRQYQYHQLEKPSGVEVEIPVHKALAMDLLKGGSYRTPPLGLIGLKPSYSYDVSNLSLTIIIKEVEFRVS